MDRYVGGKFIQGALEKNLTLNLVTFVPFLIFAHITQIWILLDTTEHFGHFLDTFGHFGPFWSFLDTFGDFGPFWTVLDPLDTFGKFWTL